MKKSLLLVGTALAAIVATSLSPAGTSSAATDGTTSAVKSTRLVKAPRPCGGKTFYKANGKPWVCSFDDEFGGTALNPRNWVVQTNFAPGDFLGNTSCAVDSKQNVSVSAGALHLTVRKLDRGMNCGNLLPATYSAGSVMTWHLWSQRYGRFTARMKVPATTIPGLHEAFWLWHDERYSTARTGEMDVAETYSSFPHIAVPSLHDTNNAPIQGSTTNINCAVQRGVWNTYTMEWTPTRISIWFNGHLCLVNTSADPAFSVPDIMLLSAVVGDFGNDVTPQTPIPATTLVDYVRVWK